MKDKALGILFALIALMVLFRVYQYGHNHGVHQGQLEVMRDALESGNAYWVVTDGKAEFEWRYAPRMQSTCVKYRRAE